MSMKTETFLRRPGHNNPQLFSLVTAISSCLQALNPKLLSQFSPILHPNLVIEVIKNQSNPHRALFFFNWASNPLPNPNNYSHTHQCYVVITDLLLSHSLFPLASFLLLKSNKLSDLLASKFITAYGSLGNVRAAKAWLRRGRGLKHGEGLFSCNAYLGVLVKLNRIGLAKDFFDGIVKGKKAVRPDASTYTIMIRGFCKMGMVEHARKVFDEMSCEPNLITYNTMINGYCKKGEMAKAMVVFNRLMASGDCLPDMVTYTTLIDGHCKKGEFDEAMKWMGEMEVRGCKPNLLTYNAMIYGLCLRGNVDEALKLMTKMRLNGMKENVATNISIIKGYNIANKTDKAIEYFKEIIKKGMNPDAKAFGLIVNAYCKMGKPDDAISLLKEMKVKGISPTVSSFNAVFRILVELGKLDTAISLLKQMSSMGCIPNFVSYSTVIRGLCSAAGRMQQVEELVADMLQNGLGIDATIYGCLIERYCEDGNEEMAMHVFNEAIDKKIVIAVERFLAFVKHLCGKGKAVDAQRMFDDMSRRCSVIDLDNYQRILHEQLRKKNANMNSP